MVLVAGDVTPVHSLSVRLCVIKGVWNRLGLSVLEWLYCVLKYVSSVGHGDCDVLCSRHIFCGMLNVAISACDWCI